MNEKIAEIVRDALGERPFGVEHIPTIEDSTVYLIELPSGRAFFKTEHEGHSIEALAWAYEKAAAADVPVPRVMHVDLSCEHWPQEFVIISALEGSDLQHDPIQGPELAKVLAEAGHLTRKLHAIALDGFGELERVDGEMVGEHGDHLSYLHDRLAWGLPYLVENEMVDRRSADQIAAIVAASARLVPPPPRGSLLHGDVGLDHIFVDRATLRITGFIDFEPEVADPAVDLGSFHYFYPEIVEHLLAGYGELPADLDVRLELYGLVQAVGSTRWDHEKGLVTYIARGLAEIERRASFLNPLLG